MDVWVKRPIFYKYRLSVTLDFYVLTNSMDTLQLGKDKNAYWNPTKSLRGFAVNSLDYGWKNSKETVLRTCRTEVFIYNSIMGVLTLDPLFHSHCDSNHISIKCTNSNSWEQITPSRKKTSKKTRCQNLQIDQRHHYYNNT